jgi:hypothetical protein
MTIPDIRYTPISLFYSNCRIHARTSRARGRRLNPSRAHHCVLTINDLPPQNDPNAEPKAMTAARARSALTIATMTISR